MNEVILSGRLARTPELKTTASGKSVSTFSLAVDRDTKSGGTDFITIVTWESLAEFATRYLQQGRKVLVKGRLRVRKYEDRGENRYNTEVYADNIEFADGKPQSDEQEQAGNGYNGGWGNDSYYNGR